MFRLSNCVKKDTSCLQLSRIIKKYTGLIISFRAGYGKILPAIRTKNGASLPVPERCTAQGLMLIVCSVLLTRKISLGSLCAALILYILQTGKVLYIFCFF